MAVARFDLKTRMEFRRVAVLTPSLPQPDGCSQPWRNLRHLPPRQDRGLRLQPSIAPLNKESVAPRSTSLITCVWGELRLGGGTRRIRDAYGAPVRSCWTRFV